MRAHRVARLGLARTYQITQVFPDLTVIENEMLAAQGLGAGRSSACCGPPWASARCARRRAATLERVGLGRTLDVRRPSSATASSASSSSALALVGDPRLLLLDEPAAGLSGADRGTIRDAACAASPRTITVLLIEHDMELALGLADRVTCLHNGALVAEGTPDEIRADERVQDIYLGREAA